MKQYEIVDEYGNKYKVEAESMNSNTSNKTVLFDDSNRIVAVVPPTSKIYLIIQSKL